MTVKVAHKDFVECLSSLYSKREASNIAELVLEHVTGITRLKRVTEKELILTQKDLDKLHQHLEELLLHKPVQYVLGETWFYGKKFMVNEAVLIPRPETEELVDLIIQDEITIHGDLSILDIGTGSGCIAVSLKSKLPKAEVIAIDISDKALEVAKQNGDNNQTMIQWKQVDILNKNAWIEPDNYDIIVSNPPYIPLQDKNLLDNNVLDYEPHIALFATADDPLIFYKAIAEFSTGHLKKKGKIFVEIHEAMGEKVRYVFLENNFQAEIHKDMMGKDRIITACR